MASENNREGWFSAHFCLMAHVSVRSDNIVKIIKAWVWGLSLGCFSEQVHLTISDV
jgi:hypothetical protein